MYNSLLTIVSNKEKILIDINSIISICDHCSGVEFLLDGALTNSIHIQHYYTDEMTWDDITKNLFFRLKEVEKEKFIQTRTHTITRPKDYDVNIIFNKKYIIMAHPQKNDKTKSVIMLKSGEKAIDMSIDKLSELLGK